MELKKNIAEATAKEVMDDPRAYGFPTLQEFAKNRERYRIREDRKFVSVDRGSTLLKRHVSKQTYEVEGPEGVYSCKSLEEAESVAKNMGFKIEELDILPEVLPDVAGKCTLKIRFRPKTKLILPGQI